METKKIEEAVVRAAVGRIVASPELQRAPRLAQLLQYTIEESLAGRADSLKEYALAQAVYGREAYDPKVDSLVRVEMAKLRKRLEVYYENAGKREAIHIRFDKGSYAPQFQVVELETADRGEEVATDRERKPMRLGLVAGVIFAVVIVALLAMAKYRIPAKAGPARVTIEVRALDEGAKTYLAPLQSALRERLARNARVEIVDAKAADAILQADVNSRKESAESETDSSAAKLEINLQLRQSVDGYVAWSDRFRATPDQVAGAVATKIFYDLPGTLRALRDRGTQDPDAWHYYLRGMQAIDQADAPKANEMFRAALSRDERDALAWAGLARSLILDADWYGGAPEKLREASEAAARAKSLAPDSVLVLQALGSAQVFHEHNFRAAEQSFLRAKTLDPTEVDVRFDYARLVLSPLSRHREAEMELRSAIAMSPEHNLLWNALVYVHLRSGQAEAALEAAERSLALTPKSPAAHNLRGMALVALGRSEEALGEFRFSDSDWSRGLRALAYASAKRSSEALALLPKVSDRCRRAAVYAALGQDDAALAELEEAVRRNSPTALWIAVEPALARLRKNPRFAKLRSEIGVGESH